MGFPNNTYPGAFVVIEGIDGSGLTTQAANVTAQLKKQGLSTYHTKEPTDGPAGGILRLALTKRMSITPETFALLFAADRMDHLTTDIIPRLKMGTCVVCDRYFFSNIAYQGIELGTEWIKGLNEKSIIPDLTVFLDVPPETCMERIYARQQRIEHFEEQTTLERIRDKFLETFDLFRSDHDARVAVVDGCNPIETVTQDIMEHIVELHKGY